MIGGSDGVRGVMSSSVPSTRPSRARSMPVSSHVSRIAVCSRSRSRGVHAPAGTRDVPAPRIVLDLGALDHQQLGLARRRRTQHERDRRETLLRRPARSDDPDARQAARQDARRRDGRAARRAMSRAIRCRRRPRPSRESRRPSTRRACSPSPSSSRRRTPSGCRTRSR